MLPMILVAIAAIEASTAPQSQPMAMQAQAADWSTIDKTLGRSGTTQPDGVRRYAFPRSDLKVTLDGVAIKPGLVLGSWLAFQPLGANAHVMGDLVLAPAEVKPVMSQLLAGGLQITAIHNHLLRAEPATYYMHVEGSGNAAALATTIRGALAKSATPLATPAAAAAQPQLNLDTAKLDQLLGRAGKANGGVYQFSFPRKETITAHGMTAPATMGTAIVINFQGLDGGRAATTGDFVLTASEVDPVMRALNAGGFEITALHGHMVGEEPRLYFMHFWAVGPASALASTLRSALDRAATR